MTRVTVVALWLSLALVISLGLYHTSYRVEELTRKLKGLNAQIALESRALHVLKAEWVYLSNPSRLETAARKHLSLQPTTPGQIARLDKLASLLPTREEASSLSAPRAQAVVREGLQGPRPAADRPKAGAQEKERVNTRMVLGGEIKGLYTLAGGSQEP